MFTKESFRVTCMMEKGHWRLQRAFTQEDSELAFRMGMGSSGGKMGLSIVELTIMDSEREMGSFITLRTPVLVEVFGEGECWKGRASMWKGKGRGLSVFGVMGRFRV